jgi:colanic acid biosynthesis glycosyl transferase WcaI
VAAKQTLSVLLINQYYPPDTSATAAVFRDLVDGFIDAGHEVTVVCGRPSYELWERKPSEARGRARVRRVWSTAFDRRGMKGRVANYSSFLALASLRVLASRRPDVVIAGTDPPLAVWVALLAARGRPVVYSLRDLHPEFVISSGMIRPGLITRLWDAVHTAGMSRCARVVCLGETVAERVRRKGVDPERVAVVPDGAWPSNGSVDPKVVADIRSGAEFVVMHAGNLGGAGGWETIAAAAERVNGSCRFLFVGAGSYERRLTDAIQRLPFRPGNELASVMAAGDLQIVAMRQGMEGVVVPSKLYSILAHGRPVLAVAPERCEVVRIVEEGGCGLVAHPDDPEDLIKKVEWAQSHPDALAEMGRRALEVSKGFDRGQHLRRFVELVEGVAAIHVPDGSEGRGI